MSAAVTSRKCSVDGCTKPARSRGWCPTHHGRWRRTGDPTALKRATTLDPATVVELRGKVGLPPDGPTPEMVKTWRQEDGDVLDEDAAVEPPQPNRTPGGP